MKTTPEQAEDFRPLGRPVPRGTTTPGKPAPAPVGPYGVTVGPDGKFKTTTYPVKP